MNTSGISRYTETVRSGGGVCSRTHLLSLPFFSLFFFLLLVLCSSLSAQVIESWEVYSALDRSTSITSGTDGALWVGTTGGIYRYDPVSRTSEVYRSNDALLDLTATAIGVDPTNGDVYAGGKDGTISILRHQGWWTYVTDIARAERPDLTVRGFHFHDGKVYILTTFGVAVFSPSDSTIRDSWTRFGTITPNTGVNALVFHNDSVWVGTDSGLAAAPATGRELADPLNWTYYGGGACARRVLSLQVIGGVLNVGTEDGACRLEEGVFSRRDDVGGQVRFAANGAMIVAASDSRMYRLNESGRFEELAAAPRPIVGVASLPDGTPVVAMQRDGIGVRSDDGVAAYAPGGPLSNTFEDLTFGFDGSLWCAPSSSSAGVSRLVEGEWVNYTPENTPGLTANGIWHVNTDELGRIWAGTQGDGVALLTPKEGTTLAVTQYDQTNSPLRGVAGADDFVLVTDAQDDGSGRVWFLNWDNTGGQRGAVLLSLNRNTSSGAEEFASYPVPAGFPTVRVYSSIAIDFSGTKWLGCDAESGAGLLYFKENGADDGSNKWGRLTTAHGLPSTIQTALLVDPDGELWIGTPQGPVVLVNPGTVLQSGPSSAIFRVIRPLENVYIQALAVDALNRKWVGTNEGLVVLSSDGTEVLATYTEANSPLVSNEIRSILPNDETGDIYVGTIEGMNRIRTEGVRSGTDDRLTVMPQPYELPAAEPMRITGLPPNSSVKILSLGGTLIREFDSPGGGVAFWDGNDASGEPVASGVYLVAAKSSLGETVIGKAAVVRK